jgi:CheY-like chemotaxis protein
MDKRKVVMVSKSDPQFEIYSKALADTYDLVISPSGEKMISKYIEMFHDKKRVDLVLTSYELDEVNGAELVHTIDNISRGDGPKSLVVADNENAEFMEKLQKERFLDRYLKKPVSTSDIYREVQSLIGV